MELRGALRVSKFKKTDAQPKYYGSAEINGKTYALKGWEKQGKDGMWISILFEEPEDDEEFAPTPKGKPRSVPDFGDLDDDIPF